MYLFLHHKAVSLLNNVLVCMWGCVGSHFPSEDLVVLSGVLLRSTDSIYACEILAQVKYQQHKRHVSV